MLKSIVVPAMEDQDPLISEGKNSFRKEGPTEVTAEGEVISFSGETARCGHCFI